MCTPPMCVPHPCVYVDFRPHRYFELAEEVYRVHDAEKHARAMKVSTLTLTPTLTLKSHEGE